MLYIKLFIEREKNIGQSAPECPFKGHKITNLSATRKIRAVETRLSSSDS